MYSISSARPAETVSVVKRQNVTMGITVLVDQNDGRDQMNAGKKISGEFIVTGGNGTKVLNPVEEALNEVAFTIEHEITGPLGLTVSLWRDHGGDLAFLKGIDESIGVIGLVAEQGLRIDVFKQGVCTVQIVDLARRE